MMFDISSLRRRSLAWTGAIAFVFLAPTARAQVLTGQVITISAGGCAIPRYPGRRTGA